MKKNLKVTNEKRMEMLFDLMTINSDICRDKVPFAVNKTQTKETLEKFSLELNGLGPPIRVAKEYQREVEKL